MEYIYVLHVAEVDYLSVVLSVWKIFPDVKYGDTEVCLTSWSHVYCKLYYPIMNILLFFYKTCQLQTKMQVCNM